MMSVESERGSGRRQRG